VLVKIS